MLLFGNETSVFPVLVESTENRDVILIPRQYQPWPTPETLGTDALDVVLLGTLQVTHITLRVDQHTGHTLGYQPWQVDTEGWSASRSRRSYGYLRTLKWQPCGANTPDRLVLIGSASDPAPLHPPVSIAGQIFDKEVWCVSIEL